jgi:6-pyruvoyltetrahydropterin/6-carboxytetrahydropterin synthase
MSSSVYSSTKVISLGSCAFRQWRATHSHCSKLHGYELRAKFYFAGPFLDGRNWIVDFGELDEIKSKLNEIFDHTLCAAADDPCLDDFKMLHDKGVIDLRIFERGVGIERTAEVCFEVATEYLKSKYGELRWVEKVEVFEHDKNSAIFYNPRYVDNSVFTATPEDAAAIVESYLKKEAEKGNAQLKTTIEELKSEIADQPIEAQPVPDQPAPPPVSTAAPVGPRPTTGNYSGLFAGTRWG